MWHDTTHPCVRKDSSMRAMYVTWHNALVCDIMHSCACVHMWHTAFICDTTHSCASMWHLSNDTSLNQMKHMTSNTGWLRWVGSLKIQISFAEYRLFYRALLQKTIKWNILHDETHPNDTYSNTGWRRPIGCLKLHIIFRKRATNYRALLQKTTYKDKASYGSLPLCNT